MKYMKSEHGLEEQEKESGEKERTETFHSLKRWTAVLAITAVCISMCLLCELAEMVCYANNSNSAFL